MNEKASYPGQDVVDVISIGIDMAVPGSDRTVVSEYASNYNDAEFIETLNRTPIRFASKTTQALLPDERGAKVQRNVNGQCVGCGAAEGEFHEVCGELNRVLTGVRNQKPPAAIEYVSGHHGSGGYEKEMAAQQLRDNFTRNVPPLMVADGMSGIRLPTENEERAYLAGQQSCNIEGLARNRDGWQKTATEYAVELGEARQRIATLEEEVAALKAAAAAREPAPPPTKGEVMGRAIAVTLSGWRPVL